MVKPVGAPGNGKMLKPEGPKIDANGRTREIDKCAKMVKWVKWRNGKTGNGPKMVKTLKPTGRKIDADGKMAKPVSALKW